MGRAYGIGDEVRDFRTVDHEGRTRTLANDLLQHPLVLIFYRGHW